ncbi:MAG: hypothetical protein Q9205_003114 [Flavoplaca limonia]
MHRAQRLSTSHLAQRLISAGCLLLLQAYASLIIIASVISGRVKQPEDSGEKYVLVLLSQFKAYLRYILAKETPRLSLRPTALSGSLG